MNLLGSLPRRMNVRLFGDGPGFGKSPVLVSLGDCLRGPWEFSCGDGPDFGMSPLFVTRLLTWLGDCLKGCWCGNGPAFGMSPILEKTARLDNFTKLSNESAGSNISDERLSRIFSSVITRLDDPNTWTKKITANNISMLHNCLFEKGKKNAQNQRKTCWIFLGLEFLFLRRKVLSSGVYIYFSKASTVFLCVEMDQFDGRKALQQYVISFYRNPYTIFSHLRDPKKCSSPSLLPRIRLVGLWKYDKNL